MKIKADTKLIRRLMFTQTEDMNDLLSELLKDMGCDVREDKSGNLIATKGDIVGAPVLIAHTDTVLRTEPLHIVVLNEWIMAIDGDGKQAATGADDRAGCAAILQLIPRLQDVICIFMAYEEHGGLGAQGFELELIQGASIVIELDRRITSKVASDAIWSTNGITIASAACKRALKSVFSRYGYKYNEGTFTDVGELKHNGLIPSCFNLSIGYMREHSSTEVLYLPAYMRALDCALAIIKACKGRQYPHEPVSTSRYIGREVYALDAPKMTRKERKQARRMRQAQLEYFEDNMTSGPVFGDPLYCEGCGCTAETSQLHGMSLCEDCLKIWGGGSRV